MASAKKNLPSALALQLKKDGAKRSPFPERLLPMLASKAAQPFNNEEYIFEIKWDGYRILAEKRGNTVSLFTRKRLNYTATYASISNSLKKLPYSCVLDGEVIMVDKSGKPSFDALQNVRTLGDDRLVFCIFDLLWLEGYDLMELPLMKRKKWLDRIFKIPLPHLAVYEPVDAEGEALFAEMAERDMEGIVAKRKDSAYFPGSRTDVWLKIPTRKRQEFVIGGFTESDSGKYFRSLLFGYYEQGKLRYFGHSGGGYKDRDYKTIYELLRKIETGKNPFVNKVEAETRIHWVKPRYVAEFEYATTTSSGKIRKPAIFKGFRTDKDPQEVIFEKTVPVKATGAKKKPAPGADSNWRELYRLQKAMSRNSFVVEDRELELRGIERVLWTNGNITKADLIRYYIQVAPWLLPYLRERPLSLHLKPFSPAAPGMYIKDMEEQQPDWAQTFRVKRKHKKPGKRRFIDYLVCRDLATLVYTINLGCIDLNPWNARTSDPLHPDYLVIDIDPGGGPFEEVCETAKAARLVLDRMKLQGFPKTSGKTGIHIYLPVDNSFTWPQARRIVSRLCEQVHQLLPDLTTLEDLIEKRGRKVFLDDNQNDEADTLACAYSVRPYNSPNVSAPLQWREIGSKLKPEHFHIENMQERIRKKGNLFKEIFSDKICRSNAMVLQKLL